MKKGLLVVVIIAVVFPSVALAQGMVDWPDWKIKQWEHNLFSSLTVMSALHIELAFLQSNASGRAKINTLAKCENTYTEACHKIVGDPPSSGDAAEDKEILNLMKTTVAMFAVHLQSMAPAEARRMVQEIAACSHHYNKAYFFEKAGAVDEADSQVPAYHVLMYCGRSVPK